MNIRKLKIGELSVVLDLIEAFDRVPAERPEIGRLEKVLEQITNGGGAVLGAEVKELIVGTCTVTICPNLSWSGRPYAMIENVVVAEPFQRQGIGKAMIMEAQSIAKDAGCYKIALMTGKQRASSFKFYEACGFTGNKVGFQRRFNA